MLLAKAQSSATNGTAGIGRALAPFIVGASRSGTTLLRMMLDSHPGLAIPHETHFIPEAVASVSVSVDPRDRFLHTLRASRNWSDFHLDDDLFTQTIQELTPFDLGEALRTFYQLYAGRFGKTRWGDKTPPYVLFMTTIQSYLPEASFIHVIRDGRDVALSVRDLWFGPNSIDEAAAWWVGRLRTARAQVAHLSAYLEVRYEDLVMDTDPTLKRICNFLDLEWDAQMLAYHQGAARRLAEIEADVVSPEGHRLVRGAERRSIHAMTLRAPEADRVGRWRREMSPDDRRRFVRTAGEWLQEFEYGLE
jgi:hypothetical protein